MPGRCVAGPRCKKSKRNPHIALIIFVTDERPPRGETGAVSGIQMRWSSIDPLASGVDYFDRAEPGFDRLGKRNRDLLRHDGCAGLCGWRRAQQMGVGERCACRKDDGRNGKYRGGSNAHGWLFQSWSEWDS
jgi:hypothetical protein